MRTLEEIQKDIEHAENEANNWYKKRNKLYEELKKAQKTDVVDFEGKYVRLGWDFAVMYVKKQQVVGNEVRLYGVRIWEKDYAESDDMNRWSGEFSVGISFEPLKFDLNKFKDLTVGPFRNMEEITAEDFDDYIEEMLNEYKEKLNFEEYL